MPFKFNLQRYNAAAMTALMQPPPPARGALHAVIREQLARHEVWRCRLKSVDP